MNHTPGPWRTGAGNLLIIRAGEGHGMAVADIAPPTTRHPDIASEANAYLIAAAPDLLAFVSTLARMTTEAEMGEDGMAGEDAIAVLNEMIVQARVVSSKAQGATYRVVASEHESMHGTVPMGTMVATFATQAQAEQFARSHVAHVKTYGPASTKFVIVAKGEQALWEGSIP